MFALRPRTKFIALISGDERLSRSSLHKRKCHFSVIVYDSFLHLWLNNEGWQLERALGVGIKGLRFPLGRDESEWVCSEQTGSRCWSLCCHAYCCCHTTGSFCQPASRAPCSGTWQETLPVRAWDGSSAPNKRIPARHPRRARGSSVLLLCMLWFIWPSVCVSIPSLSPLVLYFVSPLHEGWLVEA